jgi:hypothetical protein
MSYNTAESMLSCAMRSGNRKLSAGSVPLTNQPNDWNEAAVPLFSAPACAREVKTHPKSLKNKGPAELKSGCRKCFGSLSNCMGNHHTERMFLFSA